MLTLLGRATSGNVQKVIFLLEELGLAYERQDYGRQFGNTTTPEYLAMNPTQKVPTLRDDGLVVWESNTILRYLASKAASDLYPADPLGRTTAERWMDWSLAALNPVYLAGFRDAKKAEADQAPDTAKNLGAELTILEGQLGGKEWIAGSFSIADISLGPIVRRCINFPFARPSLPNIEGWCRRLEGRPAFMTAIAAG